MDRKIKKRMLSGVLWSAVEKYSGMIIHIIVTMVLARVLSPKEFGIVAIATVLIHFLSIFSTMGIGPAIIQRKDLKQEDYNNIFSFSTCIGTILAVGFFISAKAIASFYSNTTLIPICQVLSVNLFFASANMVPNALMVKNKKFKSLAKRTLLLQSISGGISIFGALSGLGIYSLLISPIFTSVGIFFYNSHYYPVRFSLKFSIAPIKKIFSYSAYQFAFDFSNFFSRNLDKLIIGKQLSTGDLGFYDKSYKLMQMPMNSLTTVIRPVIQPFMSEFQDDMLEMKKNHNRIIKILATYSFPVAITLFFCGKEIIHIFYGKAWDPAVESFGIFSLSLPTRMILATSGAFWQSCNSTKLLFWTGLMNSLIVILGFFISAYIWKSINAVAWSWTITSTLIFFLTYHIMYKMVFQASTKEMLLLLVRPLLNAIILIPTVFLVDVLCSNLHDILSLIFKLIMALGITILYLHYYGSPGILASLKNKKFF